MKSARVVVEGSGERNSRVSSSMGISAGHSGGGILARVYTRDVMKCEKGVCSGFSRTDSSDGARNAKRGIEHITYTSTIT